MKRKFWGLRGLLFLMAFVLMTGGGGCGGGGEGDGGGSGKDDSKTVPTINTSSLPDGIRETTYSQMLSASGAPVTWTIASGNLPDNLRLDTIAGTVSDTLTTIGIISGTPTTVGTSSFTVQATNSAGSATKTLSITIAENAADVSAEASEIVSRLQSVRAAALMFYAYTESETLPTVEALMPYAENPSIFYGMRVEDGDAGQGRAGWWAGFDLKEKSSNVKNELKKHAEKTVLYGLYGAKDTSVFYADQDIIWRLIR